MDLVLTLEQIQEKFKLSKIVAEILYKRGLFTEKDISEFLWADFNDLHSPFLIPGMIDATNTLKEAAYFGDNIVLYSDYDVDGIISASILYLSLKRLAKNVNIDFYVSNRFVDGYGLSKHAIDNIHQNRTDLLVTLDCGISNHEEIAYAQSLGMEVIVIDHHESKNPPSCPFVDLKACQKDYPFRELCGGGVSYKVAQALLEDPLYDFVDLACVATVADVVPLLGENRIIVKEGLNKIRSGNANPGLQELINVKRINNQDFQAHHIGFKIGPMLNAIGRLKDATEAVELLITDSSERRKQIANKLDQLNLERQEKEKIATNRALEVIDPDANVIVYQDKDIEAGIVGLVAGNIKEKYNKPTIIIGGGNKGSCRSVNPLNMYQLLGELKEYLEKYGGHEMAAGLTLKEGMLEEFSNKAQELTEGIEYEPIVPDIVISLNEVDFNLIHDIELMAPFGMGNPKPKLLANCQVVTVGTTRSGEHLLLKIRDDVCREIDGIGFNMVEKKEICKKGNVDIIFQPGINEWAGKKKLQLILKDIK